jgi:hypothetical protein
MYCCSQYDADEIRLGTSQMHENLSFFLLQIGGNVISSQLPTPEILALENHRMPGRVKTNTAPKVERFWENQTLGTPEKIVQADDLVVNAGLLSS